MVEFRSLIYWMVLVKVHFLWFLLIWMAQMRSSLIVYLSQQHSAIYPAKGIFCWIIILQIQNEKRSVFHV